MIKLVSLVNSRIRAVEFLTLLKGIKPVVRQSFFEEEFPLVESYCRENNLFLAKSRFKVIDLDHGQLFSNKGLKVSAEDPRRGKFFAYISKDEVLAHKAALSDIRNDDFNLGRILGYPECCCRFFDRYKAERAKMDNDFEVPVLEKSPKNEYQFYSNVFLRHKDCCLLSHFPCRLDCEESFAIGKMVFSTLQEYDRKLASQTALELSGLKNLFGRQILFRRDR